MQLTSGSHIRDGLLAAMTLLSEKPRHGVPSWESAPQSGIDRRNCTAAIGLHFRCSDIVSGALSLRKTWQIQGAFSPELSFRKSQSSLFSTLFSLGDVFSPSFGFRHRRAIQTQEKCPQHKSAT
jgi:hypothetical protein